MFIDQNYQETRLAIVRDGVLEDFDSETLANRPCKGNIYYGRIVRIEPALQAAFVEFGGTRHGFLPFSEIHPSLYLKKEELTTHLQTLVDTSPEENAWTESPMRLGRPTHASKIQDVLKRNQMLLVQVTKDARAQKGAFLTTYISLVGKYCVFLPNTPKSSGVSRKITQQKERATLRNILEELKLPQEMSLIIRTAGVDKTKVEIKRDWIHLLKLWKELVAHKETSVGLVYEEQDLLARALRDFYRGDVERIVIEGKEPFLRAKKLMRLFAPTHLDHLELHEGHQALFETHGIETQIEEIYQPRINLPSGGSIVMNMTEALIAIDVNSSKATKEKNLEETAFKTNMEAARAIARQLKLRDLSGLIVIDFIDMQDTKADLVEKAFRQALKSDRARLKVGKISGFGLLEMSRQRMRQNLWETSCSMCPTCQGEGRIYAPSFLAVKALRQLNRMAAQEKNLTLSASMGVLEILLNNYRESLTQIEKRHQCILTLAGDPTLLGPQFFIRRPSEMLPKPRFFEPSPRTDKIEGPEANKVSGSGVEQKPAQQPVHGTSHNPNITNHSNINSHAHPQHNQSGLAQSSAGSALIGHHDKNSNIQKTSNVSKSQKPLKAQSLPHAQNQNDYPQAKKGQNTPHQQIPDQKDGKTLLKEPKAIDPTNLPQSKAGQDLNSQPQSLPRAPESQPPKAESQSYPLRYERKERRSVYEDHGVVAQTPKPPKKPTQTQHPLASASQTHFPMLLLTGPVTNKGKDYPFVMEKALQKKVQSESDQLESVQNEGGGKTNNGGAFSVYPQSRSRRQPQAGLLSSTIGESDATLPSGPEAVSNPEHLKTLSAAADKQATIPSKKKTFATYPQSRSRPKSGAAPAQTPSKDVSQDLLPQKLEIPPFVTDFDTETKVRKGSETQKQVQTMVPQSKSPKPKIPKPSQKEVPKDSHVRAPSQESKVSQNFPKSMGAKSKPAKSNTVTSKGEGGPLGAPNAPFPKVLAKRMRAPKDSLEDNDKIT